MGGPNRRFVVLDIFSSFRHNVSLLICYSTFIHCALIRILCYNLAFITMGGTPSTLPATTSTTLPDDDRLVVHYHFIFYML